MTIFAAPPERADALVLYAAGEVSKRDSKFTVCRSLADTTGNRIESQFPQWIVSAEALAGVPAEVILNMSGLWRPDLIMFGSEGFERERSMSSNVALEVAHRARCSVRLAKTARAAGPIQLVIGNAGSTECEGVINEVSHRQWPAGTEAQVISFVGTEERDRIRDASAGAVDDLRCAGLTVRWEFIDGDPYRELVREAEHSNADTLFIAPRCLSIKRFLLGSVATAVITLARSTVEVVRRPA